MIKSKFIEHLLCSDAVLSVAAEVYLEGATIAIFQMGKLRLKEVLSLA